MAETTHISWADATFNPWVGCSEVSPACDGCYARVMMDERYGRVQWGGPGKGPGTRERTSESNWRKPIAWNRKAALAGVRLFVFCASLADVFDNQVPLAWRKDLFALIRATPHLVWLLLTKRPQNIVEMSKMAGGLPPNAAIGTTVEDMKRARINIPALLKAKRELRPIFTFLSCEPLLEKLDLIGDDKAYAFGTMSVRIPTRRPDIHPKITKESTIGHAVESLGGSMASNRDGIDWIIAGGETDQGAHKARPTHPDAFRSLRDQAEAAGVPFHFKQHGEYVEIDGLRCRGGPVSRGDRGPGVFWLSGDGKRIELGSPQSRRMSVYGPDVIMKRVGKKIAGRALDGVTHDARPQVPAL